MRRDFTVALLAIVSTIAIIFILSFKHYQTQIDALTTKNKFLMQQNEQLEAEISYNAKTLIDLEKTNYLDWASLETTAKSFTEDSSGNFKTSWGIYLANEAKKYAIDPYLVYELLKVETGGTFNPKLVGPETKYGHAYGMSQFMKNTAPWIADMAGLPYEDKLLLDPYYSIQLSICYLDYLHHEYGNWDEALTAYHRGIAGMEAYKQKNGTAKSDYALTIQQNAKTHRTVAFAN
ncbi:transglycosylase SLT domain-containing protein [Paraliobacillus ryukyuensis]|uniref:transglycosylase SLT domain-containing protein n=1 Tax=Paraliobacillus ryukyuensis TaxID=200904 RepID=UPI0009A796FE|nr:transglycosylase SLT domain-containing protein [Paraliobacillus ryukyuensis]